MSKTHRKPFLFLIVIWALIALITIGFFLLRGYRSNWRPDAAQLKLLAAPEQIGSSTIRPPKGYIKNIVTQREASGSRLRTDSWYVRHPDGAYSYVQVTQISNIQHESLDTHLRDQLQDIKSELSGVSISRFEHGDINGIPSARTYFKGSLKKAGGAIEGHRGFFYVLMPSRTQFIIINSSAADSYAAQALGAAEASALTLRLH